MRVLHLNTHSSGGSYEYAALLSTALAEQGIESQVLCKDSTQGENSRPLLDRVIRRSYVSFSTQPWHGTRRLLSPLSAEKLEGVDVVHLHTVADWFDVPSWLENLPARRGVVISLHDMWHVTGGCFVYGGCDRYGNETKPCARCPILKWPAKRFFAVAAYQRKLRAYQKCGARLVANSHWLAGIAKQSLITRACGGLHVIPPGIDTNIFKPQNKQLCRMQVGLPADAFVIMTGGASLNDTNKNMSWLFEQLSCLPDLRKVIVVAFGEGTVPVPERLNVRFTGRVPDRYDLARLFAAADVFVSASLMETYGLTLVEAMACKTPVVAFRVGGIPEAAPHGRGAILCQPKDSSALLEATTKLRDSPQLRTSLGHDAHQLARDRSAAGSFSRAFVQLYQDCIALKKTWQTDTATAVAPRRATRIQKRHG